MNHNQQQQRGGVVGGAPFLPQDLTSSPLRRHGSYQQPRPRSRGCEDALGSPRKGGSFRVPRRKNFEPEFDFHSEDRYLPVPPVDIRLLSSPADADDEDDALDPMSISRRRLPAAAAASAVASKVSAREEQQQQQQQQRRTRDRRGNRGMNFSRQGMSSSDDEEDGDNRCRGYGYDATTSWCGTGEVSSSWLPPEVALLDADEDFDINRRRSSTMHQYDPPRHLDQFDEFVYQSQHIGSASPTLNAMNIHPPEVNIEVPSDSDSSRRPSKASYGNESTASSSFTECMDNNACSPGFGGLRSPGGSGSRRASSAIGEQDDRNVATGIGRRGSTQVGGHHPSLLLAARPVLDRRSSHTGVPRRNGSMAKRGPSPRRDTTVGGGGSNNMLGVPGRRRSRGASLPGSIDLNSDEIYRLRNFSLAGRKVINRGDSLKARSNHSINSIGSNAELGGPSNCSSSRTNSGEDFSRPGSGSNSRRASSRTSRRSSSMAAAAETPAAGAAAAIGQRGFARALTVGTDLEIEVATGPPPQQYRVAILGSSGVGKSALTSQFLSSDHMNTYDNVEDDVQKVVSISVDGKESQLIFIDHAYMDMSIENQIATYEPNGYMVVFAVDEEESLQQAERILQYLKGAGIIQQFAVILVANKTDLVRSRVVSSSTGKSLATRYGCKYIETSPGINHNVDELLVGMLTQIQLRLQAQGQGSTKSKVGLKVMDLLERVWKMQNNKSKSCGNLHVL